MKTKSKSSINSGLYKTASKNNRKNSKIIKNNLDILDIDKLLQKNQVGDAEIFVDMNRGRYCYDCSEKQWYKFVNTHWVLDVKNDYLKAVSKVCAAYEDMKAVLTKQYHGGSANKHFQDYKTLDAQLKKIDARISARNTTNRMKSIQMLAGSGDNSLAISGNEWDKKPMVLCCDNKVVDLTNGKVMKTSYNDFLKTCAPVEWKGLNCKAPKWNKFLLSIFNNDQELVDYMLRLLGYSLTGKCTEHVLSILLGRGRNGKGTLFEVLGNVLGDFAKPFSHELLMKITKPRNSSDASPDLMDLRGRRIAWASEIDDSQKLNRAMVKRLTGNDSIKARNLYSNLVDFRPSHQLFLLTNSKPIIEVEDFALLNRIQILEFPISFVDNPTKPNECKRDHRLMEKLLLEKSGIVASLVRGCLEWQKKGLCPPEKVLRQSRSYMHESVGLASFLEGSENSIIYDYLDFEEVYCYYLGHCDAYGYVTMDEDRFQDELLKACKMRSVSFDFSSHG